MAEPAPRCIIFLMGPTGSGKTDLSLRLCEQLACEIVSVDSALIYKGMDIGTAKPTPAQRRKVPHHLIDILDPSKTYSAAAFRKSALKLIDKIMAGGKVPLLVGGTMFYFHVLEHGLDYIPSVAAETRRELRKREHEQGLAALYAELQQVDTVTAKRLHPNDSQRIKHALGVYHSSGRALSTFQSGSEQETVEKLGRLFPLLKIGLDFSDRALLHARLERRFDAMLTAGLVDEVADLMLRADLDRELPSLRSVGYHQVGSYLLGQYDYEQMRTGAVVATRQLAKRQLTWMRGMHSVHRYAVDYLQATKWVTTVKHMALEFSA